MSIRLSTLGGLTVRHHGAELTAASGQPIRSALLVYLAVERTATRDEVVATLWPDRHDSRARHALSQTLYELRKSLGDDWVDAGGDTLRTTDLVQADAVEFRSAVEEERFEDALELYGGPFLDGVHLAVTEPFQDWVDRERARLGRLHRKARRAVIERRQAAGDLDGAREAARGWVDLDPLDDEGQHRLIELLAATGQRSEALQHFDGYRSLLAEELGVEPLEETVRLAREIRSGSSIGPVATGTAHREEPVTPDADGPKRVAVLPFLNLSPDPDWEYLSDGITEELINRLARLEDLAVAARTSAFAFKGSDADVREIGRRLSASHIIEGSVRVARGQLRVRARLVPVQAGATKAIPLDDVPLERSLDDVFTVQDQIAQSVVDALRIQLGWREETLLTEHPTEDPKAFDLYMLGRYHWNQRTPEGLQRAVEAFREAIALDPEYALAYSGLADALVAVAQFQYRPPRDVLPDAERAGHRALELNSRLPEAHTTIAHIRETFYWDWDAAERGYLQAVEIDPRYAFARAVYADMLTALGRHDEAREQMREAQRIEPLSVPIRFQKGTQLYRSGAYGEALKLLETVTDMAPDYFAAHVFVAATLTAMDRAQHALQRASAAIERIGPLPALIMIRGHAAARRGLDDEVRAALAGLERHRDRGMFAPALYTAILYGDLGDMDAAFDWLGRACEERLGQLIFLDVDPAYDALRVDPRFRETLDRLGLT